MTPDAPPLPCDTHHDHALERASGSAAEPLIERMTTRYHSTQDRLQVAGTLPGGQPVVLWITQRLWLRLLPRLLQWLAMQCDAGTPSRRVASLGAAPVTALYVDLQQGFAQQAAVQQLVAQSPVDIGHNTPAHLVEGVGIGHTATQVHLRFQDEHQVVQAALVLDGPQLRQWLSIVCRQWQGGQWPMDAWPDWLQASRAAQKPELPDLVH